MKNSGLLGAKVLKIGNHDADSSYRLVATIIASDSDLGIARLATNYLSNGVVLKTLGIIDSKKLLPLNVVLPHGERKKVSVESAKWIMRFYWAWYKTTAPTNNEIMTIFDDKSDTLPFYLSRVIPSSNRAIYWFKYIPEDKILYFQFNRVIDQENEPFRDFTKRLFKTFDKHIDEIDKFVIDLRFNDGGNGYLLPPLVREFVKREDSFKRGKLYIITGNHTFSAASNFIGQMLENTSVITVGDIAAGPLNWCSDTIMFILPNSNLLVNISTMFWQKGHPLDRRGYYPPDYYIPTTFKDYASCSDPVLEAIKANKIKSLKDILFNEGVDKFKSEFLRREKLYGYPKSWFPYISSDMIFYSNTILIPVGKIGEALEIARLNAVLNPKDVRAWHFLANMNEEKGELKEAVKCYEKLLLIEPYFSDVRRTYHILLLLNTFIDQGINAMAKLFKNLKKSNPYEINEGILNRFGHRMLRNNRIQDAIVIFRLNVDIHPSYANGYDSLGEAYMKGSEYELAIKNYEKSLELNPNNNNAKEMLKKLEEK